METINMLTELFSHCLSPVGLMGAMIPIIVGVSFWMDRQEELV